VPRICADLNVWCAAILADAYGRRGTAAQTIVDVLRTGRSERGAAALVISFGMLERLARVLVRDLDFAPADAAALTGAIAGYAEQGPSLSPGGVGVMPIHDAEDRHVLETAWAGGADFLVTADLRGFLQKDAEVSAPSRILRLSRSGRSLIVAHPFTFAAWLRGKDQPGFGG